jgi:hypothetical protein
MDFAVVELVHDMFTLFRAHFTVQTPTAQIFISEQVRQSHRRGTFVAEYQCAMEVAFLY